MRVIELIIGFQMIELVVQDFQWVRGPEDDPNDQCAHGRLLFRVNDIEFVKPEEGIWTVSASALYLLRTLTENHTAGNSVAEGNLLFPCCGFMVFPTGDRFTAICLGCTNGIDLEIVHQGNMISINSSVGSEIIRESEWISAVLDFTDSVRKFYQSSLPKVDIEDAFENQGWAAFWQEWDVRYVHAKTLLGEYLG